jgi:hypothetical protein
MVKTKDRVLDSASNVKPYFDRAMRDEKLRENVVNAFAAAREVYDELIGNRRVTRMASRVATDKDIKDSLKTAIDELRTAAQRIQGKEKHAGRNTLLLVGIALGILFNPMTGTETRRWLKEKLFGPDEEFGYESPGSGNSGAGSS